MRDEDLVAVVRECQEIEGQELFAYVDEDGAARTIDSGDVNAYLRRELRLHEAATLGYLSAATVSAESSET